MEPGHEDREYTLPRDLVDSYEAMPQWSPVMKTGNTRTGLTRLTHPARLNGARS